MQNRVQFAVFLRRSGLILLWLTALVCAGCATTRWLRPEAEPASIAARICNEAEHISGCANGEIVAANIERIWGDLEDTFNAFEGSFWECSSVQIGPKERGLLVAVDSGSAVGNDDYLVYRISKRKLVYLGSFRGSVFRLLPDRVNNGFYDIETMWHTSSSGGPYRYYRWTGSSYEQYESGDTEKERGR